MCKYYQCPYEKACKCLMDEECKGCETWAMAGGVMYLGKEKQKLEAQIKSIDEEFATIVNEKKEQALEINALKAQLLNVKTELAHLQAKDSKLQFGKED